MSLLKCASLLLVGLSAGFSSSVHAMGCPSANINDVVNDPLVVTSMDSAWSNSKEGTVNEHIEGFNIYQCTNPMAVDGNIYTTEIDWGTGAVTSITYPPNRQSSTCRLVGNFHTHPGVSTSDPQSNDPYESDRPSPNDLRTGLPGLIRYGLGPISGENKTFDITYGPEVNPNLTWTCDISSDTAGNGAAGASDGSNASTDAGTDAGTGAGTGADANTDGNSGVGTAGTDEPTGSDTAGVGDTAGIEAGVTAGSNTDVGNMDGGNTGDTVAAPKPVSYNDPHIITLDGVAFSFQAVGEFVLAESTLGNFTVQARQQQTGEVSSQVSRNTGFAFKVGSDEVVVMFNFNKDLLVFVNKEDVVQQGEITLPNGGLLSVAPGTISVDWQDGSKAIIDRRNEFMNLSLRVADAHKGQLSGLLGNFDGNSANDMFTNLGVDISLTPKADEFYGIFANGWRVTDETSLFVYFENRSTAFYTNRLFPGRLFNVNDLSDTARSSATTVCSNAGITNALLLNNCILDIGAASDAEYAEAMVLVQSALGEGAADLVELVVQGQLEIPDVACSSSSLFDAGGLPVLDVSGVYSGILTNPDLLTQWDATLEFEQCGASVNGLLSLATIGGSSFKRRFAGGWSEGQLTVNMAFPYSYSLAVGQTACVDMVATLTGDETSLQGPWVSSNCLQGGLIDISRDEPAVVGSVEFTDSAIFMAAAKPDVTIGFDEHAANTVLTGFEYATVQIQSRLLTVVAPPDRSPSAPNPASNVNSAPNGLSASFAYTASGQLLFDDLDDNFTFVFTTPVTGAGLWIGNIGAATNDEANITKLSFLGVDGNVLASYDLSQASAGLVGAGVSSRIFRGLRSEQKIASIVIENQAADGDGIVLDDLSIELDTTAIP